MPRDGGADSAPLQRCLVFEAITAGAGRNSTPGLHVVPYRNTSKWRQPSEEKPCSPCSLSYKAAVFPPVLPSCRHPGKYSWQRKFYFVRNTCASTIPPIPVVSLSSRQVDQAPPAASPRSISARDGTGKDEDEEGGGQQTDTERARPAEETQPLLSTRDEWQPHWEGSGVFLTTRDIQLDIVGGQTLTEHSDVLPNADDLPYSPQHIGPGKQDSAASPGHMNSDICNPRDCDGCIKGAGDGCNYHETALVCVTDRGGDDNSEYSLTTTGVGRVSGTASVTPWEQVTALTPYTSKPSTAVAHNKQEFGESSTKAFHTDGGDPRQKICWQDITASNLLHKVQALRACNRLQTVSPWSTRYRSPSHQTRGHSDKPTCGSNQKVGTQWGGRHFGLWKPEQSQRRLSLDGRQFQAVKPSMVYRGRLPTNRLQHEVLAESSRDRHAMWCSVRPPDDKGSGALHQDTTHCFPDIVKPKAFVHDRQTGRHVRQDVSFSVTRKLHGKYTGLYPTGKTHLDDATAASGPGLRTGDIENAARFKNSEGHSQVFAERGRSEASPPCQWKKHPVPPSVAHRIYRTVPSSFRNAGKNTDGTVPSHNIQTTTTSLEDHVNSKDQFRGRSWLSRRFLWCGGLTSRACDSRDKMALTRRTAEVGSSRTLGTLRSSTPSTGLPEAVQVHGPSTNVTVCSQSCREDWCSSLFGLHQLSFLEETASPETGSKMSLCKFSKGPSEGKASEAS